MSYWNQLWVIGRKSEKMYVRFYPNPGFMIPWFKGKTLKYSKFYGWSLK